MPTRRGDYGIFEPFRALRASHAVEPSFSASTTQALPRETPPPSEKGIRMSKIRTLSAGVLCAVGLSLTGVFVGSAVASAAPQQPVGPGTQGIELTSQATFGPIPLDPAPGAPGGSVGPGGPGGPGAPGERGRGGPGAPGERGPGEPGTPGPAGLGRFGRFGGAGQPGELDRLGGPGELGRSGQPGELGRFGQPGEPRPDGLGRLGRLGRFGAPGGLPGPGSGGPALDAPGHGGTGAIV